MSGEISRRTGASELVKDDAVTVTTEAKVSGEQVIATEQEKTDAQDVSVVLVDFESGDPEDPQNWSPRYKWTVTSMLTVMSFTVNLSIVMCAPAVPIILKEFSSDSQAHQTLIVSIWELGEVIGPLVIAPLAELYGRKPVYNSAAVLFCILSVACALSTNLSMLLAFRFLIGMTPPTATLNSPIVADMFTKEQRGKAISMVQLPALLGTVLGPTIGSYLTARMGWRWTFWLAAIICGTFSIVFAFVYRETYRVLILQKRVEVLQKTTGNYRLRSKYDSGLTKAQVFRKAMLRPLYILATSPIVQLMGLYVALVYGYLFTILTTIGEVFQGYYDFPESSLGLVYIGLGIGMIIAILLCRQTLDKVHRAVTNRVGGGQRQPEHRLPPMIVGGLLLPIGLFGYGWSAQAHVHPVVPIIFTGVCGFGLTTTTIPSSAYMVDTFGIYAASVAAAMAVLKYATGAILPLAGPPLYSKLGIGWGNSVLGFIALGLLPVPILLMFFGAKLRQLSRLKIVS